MKSTLQLWSIILNRIESEKVEETYFFDFSDNKSESCALKISQGTCQFIDGEPANFTNKISIKVDDLAALLSKEKTVKKLIVDGKLTIEGKDENLEKFALYFSGDPEGLQIKPKNYPITENEKEQLAGIWTKPKKILVLNGSPRKDRGATGFAFSFLKQGLDECDCEIDVVYVADLENKPCKGCFTCWNGKDKKCVHKDDVNDLILSFPTYDLMILAAPVYVDGLPGTLKNIIDRTICLIDPDFILQDNHCRHPMRYPKMPHLLLFSTIGFTEMDNFYPMVDHVKKICKNMHLTYLGEILPPTAWMMTIPNLQPLYKGVFEALKQAGKEIVEHGKIPDQLTKQITKPIFSRGQIFAVHNRNR